MSADNPANDPQYAAAFRAMHAATEAVRTAGVTGRDVWALLFGVLQDQQAADFGTGSERHRNEVTAQHDSLSRTLDEWDVDQRFGTA